MKYKDDKGHTIQGNYGCDGLLLVCPFCNEEKEFNKVI